MIIERQKYRSQSSRFGLEEEAKIADKRADVIGSFDKFELRTYSSKTNEDDELC